MKKLLITIWIGLFSTIYAGNWVDLGKTANLTDKEDDTQAFNSAVRAAGDGGTIYISGTCYLNSPVKIIDKSISIVGSGIESSAILFTKGSINALTFENKRSGGSQWEILDVKLQAEKRDINIGVLVKDTKGKGNGSSLYMSNAPVRSNRKSFFKHAIQLEGLTRVHIENAESDGNWQSSLSAIRIGGGKPSGEITIANCWFLNLKSCIIIEQGVEMLKLRRTNFVKCHDNIVHKSGNLENFIMMNCNNQIKKTMKVRPSTYGHLSGCRFTVDSDYMGDIGAIIKFSQNSPTLITGNIIKRGFLALNSGKGVNIVGNAFENSSKELEIKGVSNVRDYANNINRDRIQLGSGNQNVLKTKMEDVAR